MDKGNQVCVFSRLLAKRERMHPVRPRCMGQADAREAIQLVALRIYMRFKHILLRLSTIILTSTGDTAAIGTCGTHTSLRTRQMASSGVRSMSTPGLEPSCQSKLGPGNLEPELA